MESRLQSRIIKHLESHGWYVIKLKLTNKSGIPDLEAFKRNKDGTIRILWIEVKSKDKKPRPLQLHRHKELANIGFTVLVIDDFETLLTIPI